MMVFAACSDHREPAPAAGKAAEKPAAPAPVGPIADDYKGDIDNLCNVLVRSGADQYKSSAEQQPLIAMWLGPNIKTKAGHDFLISIAPLQGVAKADALDAEAKRVGITCPLAVEWRKPGAVSRP